MKKFFCVCAALFALGCSRLFAFGIGVQAGPVVGSGFGFGGAVTFKTDSLPCVFAVSVPSFNPFALGVTADWWIDNPSIKDSWKWFYGVGLAGAVYFSDSAAALGFGGRALIGTNLFLAKDFIELYAEAAWQPMIHISNGIGVSLLNFPIDIGIRFWF